jgi:hypothetical protein
MMTFLHFTFESIWHFLGVLVLICTPLAIVADALARCHK